MKEIKTQNEKKISTAQAQSKGSAKPGMKYLIVLGDGMADYAIEQLSNKTPLEYANKPTIDWLARHGEIGLVKTVPDSIAPGSDVANLSVLGYDPRVYYSGRSPLEAVSMKVQLSDADATFRCNLVTLSEQQEYANKIMLDYSADEISTVEAAQLIETVNQQLSTDSIKFYPGISYRHLMVWRDYFSTQCEGRKNYLPLVPPHDILDKNISAHMPSDNIVAQMMIKSYNLLKDHPVNKARMEKNLRPANSIWLWGQGSTPSLPEFYEKFHLKGSVVSAVDLVKGIGLCAGMSSVDVEGATGNIHTNFGGKAAAVIEQFERGQDFVYLHIEAPDECGHRGEVDNKVKSIELIDREVVSVVKRYLDNHQYSIMVLPDHPTPLKLRTHTSEPVPFLIYRSNDRKNCGQTYSEASAKNNAAGGENNALYFSEGHKLIDYFLLH